MEHSPIRECGVNGKWDEVEGVLISGVGDGESKAAKQWLSAEDEGCFQERTNRLAWLISQASRSEIWMFPGGWVAKSLFEEARYCFVYGQFLASALLGFAYVERTLAAMFYRGGRNDLQRATCKVLFKEAVAVGWIEERELEAFEKARCVRNSLVHFRKPADRELPEFRALERDCHPYEVLEADAKQILQAVFRLVAMNAGS